MDGSSPPASEESADTIPDDDPRAVPRWAIVLLAVFGGGVAVYLAYLLLLSSSGAGDGAPPAPPTRERGETPIEGRPEPGVHPLPGRAAVAVSPPDASKGHAARVLAPDRTSTASDTDPPDVVAPLRASGGGAETPEPADAGAAPGDAVASATGEAPDASLGTSARTDVTARREAAPDGETKGDTGGGTGGSHVGEGSTTRDAALPRGSADTDAALSRRSEADGDTARRAGDHEGAIRAYKTAFRAQRRGVLLKKIGQCYNATDDFVNGARYLRRYLKKLPPDHPMREIIARQIRE